MTEHYIGVLTTYLHVHGDIPAVRVSSAQARGAAKNYSYWGAVRYTVTLTKDGAPTLRALERASSDRRSRDLARADAMNVAEREHRILVQCLGRVTEADARCIVATVLPAAARLGAVA